MDRKDKTADFDPAEVTRIMEERIVGWASNETAAKELVKVTGLDIDVARAFCKNVRTFGTPSKSHARGYKKGEWPKKKTSP